MLAMRAAPSRTGCSVSITTASWQDVRAAIGRAVTGDVLGGRMLDALPLDGSSLASHLAYRNSHSITAAKRGFLQKLFR